MIPGINPKQMKQVMKKMGIKQDEIEATEVIIKTKDKEIIVENPQVIKMNMMGQDSLQITGKIHERHLAKYTEEDVQTVMQQADCDKEAARQALEETQGDLAEAILILKK